MGIVILLLAMLLPPLSAIADGCLMVQGPSIINNCQSCIKVTISERRPATTSGQSAETVRQDLRSVVLAAGQREALAPDALSAITDIAECP